MAALDLDAVAIVPGANFQYLTGGRFSSMERPTMLLVPAEGEVRAIMPALEMLTWERLEIEARVHSWRDGDGYAGPAPPPRPASPSAGSAWKGSACAFLRSLPSARRCLEPRSSMRSRLSRGCVSARMPARSISSAARSPSPSRRWLRHCSRPVGVTERTLESLLVRELFAAGAESLAFPPIVVAGAQSAEGHGHAGDYSIRPGDTLLFDFGAAVGGYNADVTRTVFVGEPAAEARALYETVYEANGIGRAFARPGVTAGAVDDAVQTVLEASRFVEGDLIKTGHGLGLDVHEAPQVMRGTDIVLEPGMVFTIEPGLYLPGRRGVRIEDDVGGDGYRHRVSHHVPA